jgi:hypothetical protein
MSQDHPDESSGGDGGGRGGGGLTTTVGGGAAVEMHAAVAGSQYVPIHWAVAKDGLLTRKPWLQTSVAVAPACE